MRRLIIGVCHQIQESAPECVSLSGQAWARERKWGRRRTDGGSRRLEGGLLTGANLRTKGQKFLLYLLDLLLWRQLKGRYWWGGWRANQEGGGRSGRLTLVIKRSDKLFHGVNEDGEFGEFGFRGRSKGRSERKRTIARGRRSCGAMKDKACSVVDLF